MKRQHALDRALTLEMIPKKHFLSHPGKVGALSLIARAVPYSQLNFYSLLQMYDAVRDIDRNKLSGSIVEMGCGRGGTSALMAKAGEQSSVHRDVWMFDSFQGLSEPNRKDFEETQKPLERIKKGYLQVRKEVAEEALDAMGVKSRDRVHIVEGWFEDTVPSMKSEVGPIAILRIDADLYEPTKFVLEEFYNQVEPGGYIVFDDYNTWIGSKRAIHDFFDSQGITVTIKQYQGGRAYIQK